MRPFLKEEITEPYVQVIISWDWESDPWGTAPKIGSDLLQDYFGKNEIYWCATKGGQKGYVACATYSETFRSIKCTINEKPFLRTAGNMGTFLRYLPMRSIFQHYGTIFLHAAQIVKNTKGIVFSGCSGAGKTTQSKLWERFENAARVCNDRTLLKKREMKWKTYGYPIDGSEPVISGESFDLGSIVFLEKANDNVIETLSTAEAVAALMSQAVIDSWNPIVMQKTLENLLEFVQEVPIYHFFCTPDIRAVQCLKQQLRKDSVI